ncbi:DUF938 domain-containing protein [Calothrix sp. NIES-3974]|uniref:DUF938 domain-containing protein n=1 Tax=Calothrix sp. NIES-3974 TaxID=2005462 RepID=UPI000B61B9B3|nr:DUF938 domain-containing protein [Calothrix sp. NIES-3974]BAZ07724.1 hypothetical protein NIES3974_43890 [Calothrix sp. NIES-3974]
MDNLFDARQFAPATQRNRQPILQLLSQVLPPTGTVLEISSGTGEHAVYFAPQLKPRKWIPSDPNPTARASIAAWSQYAPSDNLYPPLDIDAQSPVWATEPLATPQWEYFSHLQDFPITAIVNINMIHISPMESCFGLMAGAERILPPGGILYMYGPYKYNHQHTAPSNEAFDLSLRSQNPDWGVRNLQDVVQIAQNHNLELMQVYDMPANNLSVVYRRL